MTRTSVIFLLISFLGAFTASSQTFLKFSGGVNQLKFTGEKEFYSGFSEVKEFTPNVDFGITTLFQTRFRQSFTLNYSKRNTKVIIRSRSLGGSFYSEANYEFAIVQLTATLGYAFYQNQKVNIYSDLGVRAGIRVRDDFEYRYRSAGNPMFGGTSHSGESRNMDEYLKKEELGAILRLGVESQINEVSKFFTEAFYGFSFDGGRKDYNKNWAVYGLNVGFLRLFESSKRKE